MIMEGSYVLSTPCYNNNLLNPDTPKECARGSPWVIEAQKIMGGDIAKDGVKIHTIDNYHRVFTSTPTHLPQVNNTCPKGGKHPCTLETLTVSENFYDRLYDLDFGTTPHAATEHKAKMLSRQVI
jgi:hypothetical protein